MARRRGHPSDEIRRAAAVMLANQTTMLAVLMPRLPEIEHVPTDREIRALTQRERQVAELVAQGLSNRQIAARLGISLRTAQSHVEHILGKLIFTNRKQVIRWLNGLSGNERARLQNPRRHK